MPYKSEAQRRYFNWKAHTEGGEWAQRAHEWNQATKHKKGGFKKLPEHVKKEHGMETTDAFGVDRPDLYVVKAFAPGGVAGPEAKKQRRTTAAVGAIPGIWPAGPAVAASYAPKGRKVGAFGRAAGRSVAHGVVGAGGGGALGAVPGLIARRPQAAATGSMIGAQVGTLAGSAHGAATSLKTTQRRYGVQRRP
jgi:hypothetical protein